MLPLRFMPLVWANLKRNRLRSLFTAAAVMAAFTLFGAAESLRYGLEVFAKESEDGQLIVQARGFQPIPLPHVDKIRRMPEVEVAVGYAFLVLLPPGEDRTRVVAGAVDPQAILELYPKLLADTQVRDMWNQVRTAALVRDTVAADFGWKVGDTVALRSQGMPRKDGSTVWEVTIAGLFGQDEQIFTPELLLRSEYFVESSQYLGDSVGQIVVRARDPSRAVQVGHAIDAAFANSGAETRTVPFSLLKQRSINQMGNVGAVLLAVMAASFFTMLLITGNAMSQAVRERLNEIGVLQTLGFAPQRIAGMVLLEMLVLVVAGGSAGLATAGVLGMIAPRSAGGLFPEISLHAVLTGTGLMLLFAAVSAVLPALRAWRAGIVDNLRGA